MELSSSIFYSMEALEQVNYLSSLSRAVGLGKKIRGGKSPYTSAEVILESVKSLDNKTAQLEFSINKVESFIQEEKAYTEENGTVRIYGDEEDLSFFLSNEAFTYGGK